MAGLVFSLLRPKGTDEVLVEAPRELKIEQLFPRSAPQFTTKPGQSRDVLNFKLGALERRRSFSRRAKRRLNLNLRFRNSVLGQPFVSAVVTVFISFRVFASFSPAVSRKLCRFRPARFRGREDSRNWQNKRLELPALHQVRQLRALSATLFLVVLLFFSSEENNSRQV